MDNIRRRLGLVLLTSRLFHHLNVSDALRSMQARILDKIGLLGAGGNWSNGLKLGSAAAMRRRRSDARTHRDCPFGLRFFIGCITKLKGQRKDKLVAPPHHPTRHALDVARRDPNLAFPQSLPQQPFSLPFISSSKALISTTATRCQPWLPKTTVLPSTGGRTKMRFTAYSLRKTKHCERSLPK